MSDLATVHFLVALRRGNGLVERAPEPVNAAAVLDMMGRLRPFQELQIAVMADPPKDAQSGIDLS